MSKLSRLRNTRTLSEFARLLGVKGSTLSYVLYKISPDNKYTEFSIPKRGGGQRRITAPNSRLKFVQRRLAALLSEILFELERSRSSNDCIISHGFKSGLSIVTNADFHRNKRHVFNIDLKEFFPSINFGRVRGFFIKDRNFLLDAKIATVVAQVSCYNNQLPQGSPCSPVISNLIAHILDIHLNRIATASRCSYTRYVDDITFSTNEKRFPSSIARSVVGSKDRWVAGDSIVSTISRSGFKVNELKTRMQYRDSRQDTTGLIVNKKINVRHEYYKKARAMCNNLFKNGFCYENVNGKFEQKSSESLAGMMSFIYFIRKFRVEDFKIEQAGFSSLYSRFLDYMSFYGISKPRIICEGKTDNIYIKCAIRRLALKFPSLCASAPNQSLSVNFFNYSETTAMFQDLSGGGDDLNKFLSKYGSRTSSFKYAGLSPVIIVVDNDSGSKNIFKHLSNLTGSVVDGSKPYYYAYSNLYVVPVPKKGASAQIEDLFDPSVLSLKIDGRRFDLTNKEKDGSKWFGKFEFATKIVSAQRSQISFDGFEPLLKAFEEVLAHNATRTKVIP